MAIRANSTEEQVDATSFGNHLLVMCTLSLQVRGVSVEDMDVLLRAVNMVEQVASHERMVAFRMVFGQSYIFVHVESQHVLERNTAFLVGLHEAGIHTFGRRAGRQAQHELVIGRRVEFVDTLDDMLCCPT